jgi:hypothetical protein
MGQTVDVSPLERQWGLRLLRAMAANSKLDTQILRDLLTKATCPPINEAPASPKMRMPPREIGVEGKCLPHRLYLACIPIHSIWQKVRF